jgi:hypothetical protein
MARQCSRGRLGAAWGSLHRRRHRSIGSTRRGCFHLCRSATTTTAKHTAGTARRTAAASGLEAMGAGGAWAKNGKGSPRRCGVCQIHLVEEVEAIGVHRLPQVSATKVAGVGRNRRATAEATRVWEWEREERERQPRWLSGSIWPTQQGG